MMYIFSQYVRGESKSLKNRCIVERIDDLHSKLITWMYKLWYTLLNLTIEYVMYIFSQYLTDESESLKKWCIVERVDLYIQN